MTREQKRRRLQREREDKVMAIKTIMTLVSIVIMLCYCNYIATTYTREATVVEMQGTEVVFCDDSGYEWVADNVKDVVLHQRVKLIMDNNCESTTIYDDYIKKIIPLDIVME